MLQASFNAERWVESTACVIADDPAVAHCQAATLTDAGFRLQAQIGFSEAAERQEWPLEIDLALVDLRNAADLSAFDLLIDWVSRGNSNLIIQCDVDQLDHVFSGCDPTRAHILCQPTPAESASVLALCRQRQVFSGFREAGDEGERLRYLNQEVARIADMLARLAAPKPLDRPALSRSAPEMIEISSDRVRNMIRTRRLRDRYFGEGLFADPAWDMLLDLFAAELERAQVSVSSLCIAAAVPPTTALRWITMLVDQEWLAREADPEDRRRAHVKLTGKSGIAMRNYFHALDQMIDGQGQMIQAV